MSERSSRTDLGILRDRELFDDIAWFVVSMVSIAVYFMCAMLNVPFWAFGWLLAPPLIWSVRCCLYGF